MMTFWWKYVETMRHYAILLYVSHLSAYWETNTAVVSEQLMQHFFM